MPSAGAASEALWSTPTSILGVIRMARRRAQGASHPPSLRPCLVAISFALLVHRSDSAQRICWNFGCAIMQCQVVSHSKMCTF